MALHSEFSGCGQKLLINSLNRWCLGSVWHNVVLYGHPHMPAYWSVAPRTNWNIVLIYLHRLSNLVLDGVVGGWDGGIGVRRRPQTNRLYVVVAHSAGGSTKNSEEQHWRPNLIYINCQSFADRDWQPNETVVVMPCHLTSQRGVMGPPSQCCSGWGRTNFSVHNHFGFSPNSIVALTFSLLIIYRLNYRW